MKWTEDEVLLRMLEKLEGEIVGEMRKIVFQIDLARFYGILREWGLEIISKETSRNCVWNSERLLYCKLYHI